MPPVYNKTRLLLLQFRASTQKSQRSMKYGIVADIERMMMNVMAKIAFANDELQNSRERIELLWTAQRIMHKVCVYTRIVKEVGGMKENGYDAVSDLEDDVLRQLELWRKSENNKHLNESPNAK